MARYVYKSNLSVKGIENIKSQLMNYRDVILKEKLYRIALELSTIGLDVAKAQVDSSPLGHYITLKTDILPLRYGTRAFITGIGEVKYAEGREPFNLLLAIEFGAGIYHNPKPNPEADKFGFGVGTYPNQIHAFENGWYYWDEASGDWKYTHGVKATMPFHNADIAMLSKVKQVVREVFS